MDGFLILRRIGDLHTKQEILLRHSIIGGTMIEAICYTLYPYLALASGFLIINNIKNNTMITLTAFCLLIKAFALTGNYSFYLDQDIDIL